MQTPQRDRGIYKFLSHGNVSPSIRFVRFRRKYCLTQKTKMNLNRILRKLLAHPTVFIIVGVDYDDRHTSITEVSGILRDDDGVSAKPAIREQIVQFLNQRIPVFTLGRNGLGIWSAATVKPFVRKDAAKIFIRTQGNTSAFDNLGELPTTAEVAWTSLRREVRQVLSGR
jgi:hypothetical protein